MSANRFLRVYRDTVVRPVLREYDQNAFDAAASGVQMRGEPYTSWRTGFWRLPSSLIAWPATRGQYHAVRVWACLCASGKWPMQLLGSSGFPRCVDAYAHCPAQDIDPAHALCDCPSTAACYDQTARSTFLPARSQRRELLRTLLAWDVADCWEDKLPHILYVYASLKISAGLEDDPNLEKWDVSEPALVGTAGQDIDNLLAECGFHV